jgi:hypothetical protein
MSWFQALKPVAYSSMASSAGAIRTGSSIDGWIWFLRIFCVRLGALWKLGLLKPFRGIVVSRV